MVRFWPNPSFSFEFLKDFEMVVFEIPRYGNDMKSSRLASISFETWGWLMSMKFIGGWLLYGLGLMHRSDGLAEWNWWHTLLVVWLGLNVLEQRGLLIIHQSQRWVSLTGSTQITRSRLHLMSGSMNIFDRFFCCRNDRSAMAKKFLLESCFVFANITFWLTEIGGLPISLLLQIVIRHEISRNTHFSTKCNYDINCWIEFAFARYSG